MIRNNVQLKYAMKRKVSHLAHQCKTPEILPKNYNHCKLGLYNEIYSFLYICLQSCEDDEAFKLLQLSKEEQTEAPEDKEDEELIIAEYESDDELKSKSR